VSTRHAVPGTDAARAQVEPVPIGQLQIHERDVGLFAGDQRQSVSNRRGLAHDLEVLLEGEHGRECTPDEVLVVHQHDPDAHRPSH
jgi:ABC-type uncharacterized transport system ATPase component